MAKKPDAVNFSEAITTLEKGYRQFKAFEGAMEAINGLRNAEQVERETMERVNNLKIEQGKIEKSIADANTEVAKIAAQGKDAADKAKAKADNIVVAANKKLDEANAYNAAKVVEADAIIKNAQALAAEAKAERDAALIELDKINKQINEVKAKAKALLG